MKIKSIRLVFILSISLLTSCDYDDDSGQPIDPTPSTFEIISNSENHTILEQALVDTGLDEVLNSSIYTVFAPNDDAFNAIDISGLNNDEIANILLNHVINGNASANDFGNSYIKTNATESYTGNNNFIDMHVSVDGGITLNGEAIVTEADAEASNGTVHFVDAVILLPTVANLISSSTQFSNLTTALTQEDLLNILSTSFDTSPAPFTVFAPNDNAFDNFIAEDNGFDSAQDILDSPFLTNVLTYHVISVNGLREIDFLDGGTFDTIQGESLTVEAPQDLIIIDQNDRSTGVIATDITASNGVIHVVDNILLPTMQ